MDAFILEIDHETMQATITASPALTDSISDKDLLIARLKEENVLKGINVAEIDKAFSELDECEEGKTYTIAEGQGAINGEHGYIEFFVNVSGKAIYKGSGGAEGEEQEPDSDIVPELDESGEPIDYKNAIKIESVKTGQNIAKIHEPTKGINGFTLTGKEIVAKNGKPAVYRIGEGVELDESTQIIIATQEGRPLYTHKAVSVSPVYEIHGDVCYETGNIHFDGFVHITGNVQDDFIVEAKDIEINGVVGASSITCKNNLTIFGGINGHGKAEVVCNGNAEVKYINAAKVEVKGDLNVAREIVNSTIWCRSQVTAGKILGGEILALQGITARTFGSELGIPTIIEPGANYEIRRIDEASHVLGAQIHKLLKPTSTFFGDNKKFKSLPSERREEIKKQLRYFKRLKAGHDKLSRVRKKLLNADESEPNKQVIVLKHLFQDVTVRTDSCVRQFRTEVTGPAALIEDIATGTIKTVGYNPTKGKIVEEDEKKGK